MKNIKKEVNELKQRRTELFTQEITSSPAYARMFPRVLSLMNDHEKKLVECADSFDNLCSIISLHKYEFNSSENADDFITKLENLLLQIKSLIGEIDWKK